MSATAETGMRSQALAEYMVDVAPSTAPVLEYLCLFTHDLRRKQKRWQDGRLKFHSFNRRIMVYDERGNYVGDSHWRRDYDFDQGEEIQLERGGVIVEVSECVSRHEQDLSELLNRKPKQDGVRQSVPFPAQRAPPTHIPFDTAARAQHHTDDHVLYRSRPLNAVLGLPATDRDRTSASTHPSFDQIQRRLPLESSGEERAAKRQKRDSPPRGKMNRMSYAQGLFGAALTLSGATPSSSRPTPQIEATAPLIRPENQPDDTARRSRILADTTNSVNCLSRHSVSDTGTRAKRQGRRDVVELPEEPKIPKPDSGGACVPQSGAEIPSQGSRTGMMETARFGPKSQGRTRLKDTERPQDNSGARQIPGQAHQPTRSAEAKTKLRIKTAPRRGLMMLSEATVRRPPATTSSEAGGGNETAFGSTLLQDQGGGSSSSDGFAASPPPLLQQRRPMKDGSGNDETTGERMQCNANPVKDCIDLREQDSHDVSATTATSRTESKGRLKRRSRGATPIQSTTHEMGLAPMAIADNTGGRRHKLSDEGTNAEVRQPATGCPEMAVPREDTMHQAVRAAQGDDEPDDADRPPPAPRLAKLGRRGLKSREVIGLNIEELIASGRVADSMNLGERQEDLQSRRAQPGGPTPGRQGSAQVGEKQVQAMETRRPPEPPSDRRSAAAAAGEDSQRIQHAAEVRQRRVPPAADASHLESVTQTDTTCASPRQVKAVPRVSAALRHADRQSSAAAEPKEQPAAPPVISDEARQEPLDWQEETLHDQPPPKPALAPEARNRPASTVNGGYQGPLVDVAEPPPRLANPATRGRKAATKSDAAGRVPVAVIPVDPPPPRAQEAEARGNTAGRRGMTFPGFVSARGGGPWSREADDLLESGRPS